MATPLEEALTAVGASALIQKRIDPNLLEYQRRYAPLVRAIPTIDWDSNVYYFNNRTTQPVGGFVTDGGHLPVSTSTYNQNLYPIKNLQVVGAVTGYAQAVTSDLIGNLRGKEIMGAAKRLYWSVENAICWGNSASTLYGPSPQFDGLDTIASVYSGDNTNAINYAGNPFSLGAFDQLINLVQSNVAEPVTNNGWMFVGSPTLEGAMSQLLLNQQRFISPMVEVEAGLNVMSYRNIPIIQTSFLSPRGAGMGAVTAAAVNSGGSLTNGTYYYVVSAIFDVQGESLGSVECSATTSGSGVITLSFTPPVGFENSSAISYKVFRSNTSGQEALLGYVAGTVTPDGGTTILATNQIIDNGVTLIPQQSVGTIQNTQNPVSYATIGQNPSIVPLTTNGENIYLISRDSDFVIRPCVREFQPVDIYPTTASPDSLPFAIVSDCTFAVRAPKYLGRISNVNIALSD